MTQAKVWNGSEWVYLAAGPAGADGADGVGVPVGGGSGSLLAKASATDFDTEWVGSWSAYTPSIGGTGFSLGNGTAAGRFAQIGKTTLLRASITFGTTSTYGAGWLTITLPATMAYDTPLSCVFNDSSAGTWKAGFMLGTGLYPAALDANSTLIGLSSTHPFTWASGDKIIVSGTYEAA